jgi:hypothetical protein
MDIFDQGHLHPLLEHPKTNISQPGIEPGLSNTLASKELLEQLMLLPFETSTWLPQCMWSITHGLIPGAQAQM